MPLFRVVLKTTPTYKTAEEAQTKAIAMAELHPSQTYEVVQVVGEARAVRATFTPHQDQIALKGNPASNDIETDDTEDEDENDE